MTDTLTHIEITDLVRFEKIIADGQKTFVDVGNAIMAIREQRLYRKDYSTFEAYCQGRWGWGVKRAQQLARAAEFWNEQKKIGAPLPENERQARAMRNRQRGLKETSGRPEKLEYVGTENDKEEKPMATARKIPGADHGHTTPPPPPTASTVRPSVSPALFNEIHAIVNYIKRVESKEPSLSDSPGFRHIITLIQNLESRVQILLPGMETVCASEGQLRTRCTEAEAKAYCVSIGLPESDGEWFFAKMEGAADKRGNWLNGGKLVRDCYATIKAWKLAGYMASQKRSNGHSPKSDQPSAFTLKTQLDAIESKIKRIRQRGVEGPFGIKLDDVDKPEYRSLCDKKKELVNRLASLT